MRGLGTIINAASIILAGVLGMAAGGFLSERYQKSITDACGISVVFLGIGGTLSRMLVFENGQLQTAGTTMMIVSLVLGVIIGEWLRIEQRLEQFGEYLKQKSGNGNDGTFVNGFVTATLTVCVGAMAVVGSIQDGLTGDYSILLTKSILDFIIILIMASSMGKGCAFAALPVAVFQGSVTLLARMIEPVMTETALANLSYVGNIMIFCVGLNLIREKKIRVGNMLPGLVIAVLWRW